MKTITACFSGVILLAAVVCTSHVNAQKPQGELRVLFIGNSLTYTNDLPAIVAALAEATKQRRFRHKSVVFPNFGLEDHWQRGEARKAIAKGKWDVVVLQQGPSGLAESRQSLLTYARLFAQEIRAVGARPAFYMVWPSAARFNDFARVVESWQLAAREVDGLLFPAGQAWLEAWRQDATLALYGEDRFHPSVIGSYLAALVIYAKLYERSPIGLPARLKIRSEFPVRIELAEAQARLLQVAAAEAGKKF